MDACTLDPNSWSCGFSRLWRVSTPLTDFTRPFGFNSFSSTLESDIADQDMTLYPRFVQAMKYVFWIVGMTVLITVCYILFNMNPPRQVASILIFIIGLTALFFYYTKWFQPDPLQTKKMTSLCPDYLTPVAPPDNDDSGDFLCMDFVGVSMNGALQKSSPSTLQSDLQDPSKVLRIGKLMSDKELGNLCCKYGLSWVALFGDEISCAGGVTSGGTATNRITFDQGGAL